jgi:hypothetical protein
MTDYKRSLSTNLGYILGFLGMAGLALTILSLLPLNIYNVYSSITALKELIKFEHDRTSKWDFWIFSTDAKLYIIFLLGVIFSATLTILFTLITYFCRKRPSYNGEQQHISAEANGYKQYQQQPSYNNSTWFVRISSLVILLHLSLALFGKVHKFMISSICLHVLI